MSYLQVIRQIVEESASTGHGPDDYDVQAGAIRPVTGFDLFVYDRYALSPWGCGCPRSGEHRCHLRARGLS